MAFVVFVAGRGRRGSAGGLASPRKVTLTEGITSGKNRWPYTLEYTWLRRSCREEKEALLHLWQRRVSWLFGRWIFWLAGCFRCCSWVAWAGRGSGVWLADLRPNARAGRFACIILRGFLPPRLPRASCRSSAGRRPCTCQVWPASHPRVGSHLACPSAPRS